MLTGVLADAERLRARDLPVHGGRTLAYVYDSGLPRPMRPVGRRSRSSAARTVSTRPRSRASSPWSRTSWPSPATSCTARRPRSARRPRAAPSRS
ncbi:hypothetical protein BN13_670009 [Nostocoides jenkinsii Ben 74]|uniref:Uncharacterized protein n=1 Tax=Nostocoides jenkinsii Ben 74 TaxID=1193518 RepID=A0A077MCD5_9MICO|nr:hypothetical protein BN13_670009 [Tetrasphaera jenkinsii Ben 74]